MKVIKSKPSLWQRIKAFFGKHFFTKEERSQPLQLKKKKKSTAPLYFYQVDCELHINGTVVGHFPLTVKAHSKNQVEVKIKEETKLIPTNIRRTK